MLSNVREALPAFALTLLLGVAVDLLGSRLIGALTRTRGWRTAEVTVNSLRGLPTLLGLILGVSLGAARLDLDPRTLATVTISLRAAAILVVTAKLAVLTGHLIRRLARREDAPLPSSTIFENVGRVLIWLLGSLIMLAALDVSITPLLAALGVGGLAMGLALQPTLENLFSGVQVLMSRQVEPGDFIRLETGEEGWVQDVTWRNTTIKMVSNNLIIVPNSIIGRSRIVNFTSADEQHGEVVPLGVAYDSDLEHVERVVREVATGVQREVDGAVKDHEPTVRFTAFGDFRIDMVAVLQVEQYKERLPARHEFLKRIHVRFAEEGIEIPYPRRTVQLVGDVRGEPDG